MMKVISDTGLHLPVNHKGAAALLLLMASVASGAEVPFFKHTINATIGFQDGADSVFAVDLDGDGDTDVLSASFSTDFESESFNDGVVWWENDQTGDTTGHRE